MSKVGKTLREAREKKGYNLSYVADMTHISKEKLEALEQERFDVFPAESYIRGFLRTYAVFLELADIDMLALYDQSQLSQIDIPLSELWGEDDKKKKNKQKKIILFSLLFLGLLGLCLFLARKPLQGALVEKARLKALQNLSLNYNIDQPEKLSLIPQSKGSVNFYIENIATLAKLDFEFSQTSLTFSLHNQQDLLIGEYLLSTQDGVDETLSLNGKDYILTLDYVPEGSFELLFRSTLSFDNAKILNEKILLRQPLPVAYELKIYILKDNTYVRYQIGNEAEKGHLYRKQQTVKTVTNDEFTLWLGNIEHVSIEISDTVDKTNSRILIPLPKSSELVGYYKIRWIATNDGYALTFFTLE